MNCPKCFAQVPEHHLSCPICGASLTLEGELAAPAQGGAPAPGAPRPAHPHRAGPPPSLEAVTQLASRNVGGRIMAWFVIGAVVVGTGFFAWRWKATHRPPVATWPSPPKAVAGLPSGGASHTCTVTESGTVLCWGNSELGQLGDTIGAPAGVPCTVCTQGTFTQLDAGDNHTCARRLDGSVLCWGANRAGQLGTTTITECVTSRGRIPCALLPVQAPVERAVTVAAGADHSCALGADSSLVCWGSNYRGQLGVMRTSPGQITVQVGSGNDRFVAVAAGQYHTCAILAGGRMLCWGLNSAGQLGAATTPLSCGPTPQTRFPCNPLPVPVASEARFAAVAAGGEHTCALDGDGAAWCWGSNRTGQLGLGNHDAALAPAAVTGSHRFTALTAGSEFTCGLDDAGAVWCWGTNNLGQIGTGDSTDALAPVRVPLAVRALTIGAGQNHTCATVEGNRIFCWGHGREGQLGQGARADSRAPLEAGVDRGGS